MHMPMHMYIGEMAKGLTGPDMEAAQQLVHLSSDEEECNNHGCRREGKAKASAQSRGEEGKATAEAKRAQEYHSDDGDEGDDGHKRDCSRKRRFRSIAYIYKVTRPVRLHDEAKTRKNH